MLTTTDPFNRVIHLKKRTWEEKILNMYGANDNNEHGNSHPEMQGLLNEVNNTISRPNYILRDTVSTENENGEKTIEVSENREEYIRIFNDEKLEKLKALKVVVEFNKENQGDVVTTHTSSSLKSFKTTGGIIYDSSKQ